MNTARYDGRGLVEVEVSHISTLASPETRLRALISPRPDSHLWELWNSKQELIASASVPRFEGSVPLARWISSCLAQLIENVAHHELRPCLGTSYLVVRVEDVTVLEMGFGILGNSASVPLDISGCQSLWEVVAVVLPEWVAAAELRTNRWVLALDLEGTLISNAVSLFVRPGLFRFLACSRALVGRVVAFTSVSEARFREIAGLLVSEGSAPPWFAGVEYVQWTGSKKDLNFIPRADQTFTLLVDDVEEYICESQRQQWIAIRDYEPLFEADDRELDRVLELIARRTAG